MAAISGLLPTMFMTRVKIIGQDLCLVTAFGLRGVGCKLLARTDEYSANFCVGA